MSALPIIGISVGDPAGIGPEITAKALNQRHLYDVCRPLVVCDRRVLKRVLSQTGIAVQLNIVDTPIHGTYRHGVIDVLDMPNVDLDTFAYGTVAAMTGRASYEYIERVIAMALDGEIDATVTGPIHKEAIHAAGILHAGHTEIYGTLTGTTDYAMMLAEDDFRVVHVSTHVSLREAIERTRKPRILRVIQLADEALKRLGIINPRIAVAGLNPHAGENGLFGTEEIEEIIPAIDAARSLGISAEGPVPPDTVFSKLKGGWYDIVVAMYHDQGHIPTKLTGFVYDRDTQEWAAMSGVNMTLGLPIIRTSVDHGVAFDLAGKNRANPQSMIQAIEMAASLAK